MSVASIASRVAGSVTGTGLCICAPRERVEPKLVRKLASPCDPMVSPDRPAPDAWSSASK